MPKRPNPGPAALLMSGFGVRVPDGVRMGHLTPSNAVETFVVPRFGAEL